jgi:phage terminase large subunit-like protein
MQGLTYLPVQLHQYLKANRILENDRLTKLWAVESLSGRDKEMAGKSIEESIRASENTIRELVASDPLRYYVPTGDNEEIIKCVAHCKEKGNSIATIGNFSGNGTGKTETLVNILLNILIPGYNEYWFGKHDFYKDPKFNYNEIWYCSETAALATSEVIEQTFRKYLKPLGYATDKYIKHKNGRIYSIQLPTSDYYIVFKTYNQEKESYESGNISMVVFDEPPDENTWNAAMSRASRGNIIFLLNFTPLECPPFIIDKIKAEAEKGTPGYYVFTSSLYGTTYSDNPSIKSLGKRGWRTVKEAEESVSHYDMEQAEARIYGKPMYYVGLIYKNIDKNKHLIEITDKHFEEYREGRREWFMPDDKARWVYCEDPAGARPQAGVWVAINPNGRMVFVAEVPHDNKVPYWDMKTGVGYDQHFEEMRQMEQDIAEQLGSNTTLQVKKRILDKYFGNQNKNPNETLFDIYKKKLKEYRMIGRWVESYGGTGKQSEIEYGQAVVRNALDEYLPDGHPKIIIHSTCNNLWSSINNYAYKIRIAAGASFGKMIVEKFKDFADIFRYHICDKENVKAMFDSDKINTDYTYGKKKIDYTKLV